MSNNLPDNFHSVLTKKQEKFLRVLFSNEWAHISTVIDRMESEYGVSVDGPRGIGGIRSGISRYWSKEFSNSLILSEETSTGKRYRINPEYIEKLSYKFE